MIKKLFLNFSPRLLKVLVPNVSGMLRVKAGRPLVNYFSKVVLLTRGSVTTAYIKIVIAYIRKLVFLNKASGTKYLVKYLKTCSILLMQSLSLQRELNNSRRFDCAVSCNLKGLPRLIPRVHRQKIREGSTFHIKLWLTFFSIYRVIEYVGKVNLSTIVHKGVRLSNSLLVEFTFAVDRLLKLNGPLVKAELPKGHRFPHPFWIEKRSPNSTKVKLEDSGSSSTHIASLVGSVLAWANAWVGLLDRPTGEDPLTGKPYQFDDLRNLHPSYFEVMTIIGNYYMQSHLAVLLSSTVKLLSDSLVYKFPLKADSIGKLAFKIEPAGKVRIFAMVDAFTQWMLKPLHLSVFLWLKTIRSDATFDQRGKVREFTNSITTRGIKVVHSFDLSAATDRLPVTLQVLALEHLGLPDLFALAWWRILVNRWYTVGTPNGFPDSTLFDRTGIDPSKTDSRYVILPRKGEEANTKVKAVRYAVGQPIGALSSWAMLAVTHHALVAMAANRANLSDYMDDYMVLGDDIVIANHLLAKQYVDILDDMGLPVNLTKSISSENGSFEFAKRFIYCGTDVSPLSFKEMFVALTDVRGLVALVRSHSITKISVLASFLDHGYKALSNLMAPYNRISRSLGRLLLLVSAPGAPFEFTKSFAEWALSQGFQTYKGHKLGDEPVILGERMMKAAADSLREPKVFTKKEDITKVINSMLGGINDLTMGYLSGLILILHRDIMYKFEDITPRLRKLTYKFSVATAYAKRDEMMRAVDGIKELVDSYEAEAQFGPGDEQESFHSIEKITTLNRCRELRWADSLRSPFKKLAVGLGSPLRKGKVTKRTSFNKDSSNLTHSS